MENNHNKRHDQEYRDEANKNINYKMDSEKPEDERERLSPDGPLPEDDPALINPDELATFPKEVNNEDPDIDSERDSHLTNRRTSPVREGRNITRTDTTPDNDGGFM